MGSDDRIRGAIKTLQAPTVQEAHPTIPPVKSPNAMSLEEFMKRNPWARDRDQIRKAQEEQGKRPKKKGQPKTRETERSKRDDPRKSVPVARKTGLAKLVEEAIAREDAIASEGHSREERALDIYMDE
jgi:hypothetical protein